MRYFILFGGLCLLPFFAISQVKENTGWFALISNAKITSRWGAHLDVQVRSADDWDYLRTLMIRPGVIRYINKNNSLTLGYALINTYTNAQTGDKRFTENAIWQHLIHVNRIKAATFTSRIRFEQRFIERATEDVFSQRFRYMLRAVLPLAKQDSSTFSRGAFLGVQDEVFLNIQNKEKMNGSLFDQNRIYLALGYRFCQKFDLEAGYINQRIKGRSVNTTNNIVQLAVYTRF